MTNAMLIMDQHPCTNDYWGLLDVEQHMWTEWITNYRAAAKKSKIKVKNRVKTPCRAAHNAMQQPAPTEPGGSPMQVTVRDTQPMILEALNGYFENLASAATNKKLVLGNLVANLITLTTSNVEISDTIKKTLWKKLTASEITHQFSEEAFS